MSSRLPSLVLAAAALACLVGACSGDRNWRALRRAYCIRYQAFEAAPHEYDLSSVETRLERRRRSLARRLETLGTGPTLRPLDGGCLASAAAARRVVLRTEFDAQDAAWIRVAAPPGQDWGEPPAALDLQLPTDPCGVPTTKAEMKDELEAIETRLQLVAQAQARILAWYATELEVCRRNGFKNVKFADFSTEQP